MKLQRAIGIASLVMLTGAVNIMVWTQALFSVPGMVLLIASAACGVAWCIFVFSEANARKAIQGSAASGVNAVVSSVVFLGICIVLYAFVSAWDKSWDLTNEGRRDLAPLTIKVLQTMNTEVKVTCFFLKVDDELVLIAREKTRRFLEQCQKHSQLLKAEFADPQTDIMQLRAMGLTSVSPQGTIVIASSGKQRVISLSGGSPRLEEWDFTNALVNVLRDVEPKVYFLTGHSERDVLDQDPNSGGSKLMNALKAESYQVERASILTSDPRVPEDCDILVINNPDGDLLPVERDAIDAFLNRGGRLFVMLDPWLNVSLGSIRQEVLRPWLESRFGIVVGSDVVFSEEENRRWQLELRNDDGPFENVDEGFMEFKGCYLAEHPITRGFDQRMLLQAARTVRIDQDKKPKDVTASELLRSPPDFWGETDVVRVKNEGQAHRDSNEPAGPVGLAVAAVAPAPDANPEAGQPKDAFVVVVGDSDLASNGGMTVGGNFNFIMDTFAWLSANEDYIAIRPTGKENPAIVLTPGEQRAVVWISTLMAAQLIVAAGLVMHLVRRKNQ